MNGPSVPYNQILGDHYPCINCDGYGLEDDGHGGSSVCQDCLVVALSRAWDEGFKVGDSLDGAMTSNPYREAK